MKNILFYDQPAREWLEGLPIGNGRLAAMVWGNDRADVLTLNHEWLWRGKARNKKPYEAAAHLPALRHLLRNKEYFKASALANIFWGGEGGTSGIVNQVDPYQVAGELTFELDDFGGYLSRELDLDAGIARTSRRTSCGAVQSEFLANCVNGLLMFSWSANECTPFSGRLQFTRAADADAVTRCEAAGSRLLFHGSFPGGIAFRFTADIRTDGSLLPIVNGFQISGATAVQVIANIATSAQDLPAELSRFAISFADFDADINLHRARFSGIMNRIDFALNANETNSTGTTGERLRQVKAGYPDNGIAALFFCFGRYLLLSSSICGELPANLQGKWNDSIQPPWECDYHFDINLQMNYWMAEPADLPECAELLINYLLGYVKSARAAAKSLYGCRGIWLPLQNDAWMISTPESYGWSAWIGAAPWMAQHLWQHYAYTGSKAFLQDKAYPFFKEVAEFYEDYLVEDEAGVLQIMPSQSPENRFAGTGNFPVSIGVSAAMDVQLAYDALTYARTASEILGVDRDQRRLWERLQSRLPEFKVGRDGRLLEWNEELAEIEPGHRHLSHLYGLYPSELFTREKRPEQYQAAVKSLRHRLEHGGGHNGWSRAWAACLFARTGEGESFYEHYSGIIRDFATESLLDLYPPRIFQIDGNLGAVASVIEALAGFYDDKVHLLQALPAEWQSGHLRGIRIPGGHTLGLEWENGVLARLDVQIGFAGRVKLKYGCQEYIACGQCGEIVTII